MAVRRTESKPKPVADRILMLLKMRGPQSSIAVGEYLGVTGEAARQHMLRLEEQGLVRSEARARGVGRPMTMWRITELAQRRFPDTHAQLTSDLLGTIREELGDDAIDVVIRARERANLAVYSRAMADATSLAERVANLAQIRTDEGYMAEWWQEPDGTFMLVENHCPICAAAAACQEFCRSEMRIFGDVLGTGASIERIDHILAGARRCAYRITPV